jgi:hypothetical protein
MNKFVWKQVNSHHICRLGPLCLIVDPPDEHYKSYVWTIMIGASGFVLGGFDPTLEEAKAAAEKGVRHFVREISALDIPQETA